MVYKYHLRSAEDMIKLAQFIQSRVYWGGFYYAGDTQYNWKYFWGHVTSVMEACSDYHVVVIKCEGSYEVEFH